MTAGTTNVHGPQTTAGPVRPHFDSVNGTRFCQCQCEACYDFATHDMDAVCRCSACECTDSDHSTTIES